MAGGTVPRSFQSMLGHSSSVVTTSALKAIERQGGGNRTRIARVSTTEGIEGPDVVAPDFFAFFYMDADDLDPFETSSSSSARSFTVTDVPRGIYTWNVFVEEPIPGDWSSYVDGNQPYLRVGWSGNGISGSTTVPHNGGSAETSVPITHVADGDLTLTFSFTRRNGAGGVAVSTSQNLRLQGFDTTRTYEAL